MEKIGIRSTSKIPTKVGEHYIVVWLYSGRICSSSLRNTEEGIEVYFNGDDLWVEGDRDSNLYMLDHYPCEFIRLKEVL